MNVTANQTKYGKIMAVNFTIDQRNRFCKIIMINKYIKRIMKQKLLFLKDSLEP